ncbi:JmjC domain-containing protein [Zavarzinia sp. CC-PAN008]|uniref:JmjC domain-containing protein n=1 Tax=Zavarzinia sp. CC-PAN008 TaxID=3243332 RepID=UPI003F742394
MKRAVLPDQLQRFCQEGLSIALFQLHDAVPALAALVAMLEQAMPARIQTNLYASFGRESAFRAHHDPHDVLVLHLHGRKRWFGHGYRPEVSAQPGLVPDAHLAPAQWDVVLEPGDVLYIPRGQVHRAAVEGEASLHLTNSLLWPRGSDVLRWLAGGGMADVGFEADVPVYGDAADLARYESDLRDQLRRLADTVDLRAFLATFMPQRRLRLPLNLGLSSDLAPDCWVQPLLSAGLSLPTEGGACVPFNGGEVTLDPQERAMMAALLCHGTRQVADLPDLSGLDAGTACETVARLARRSLVLLVEGDAMGREFPP